MDVSRSRALTLALAAIAFAASAALAGLPPAQADGILRVATASASLELLLLALGFGCAWATRRAPDDVLGTGPGALPPSAVAGLVVATLGASHALDALLTLSDLRERSALTELGLVLSGATGGELLLALLAIGLLPALAEEILCRGLVLREVARRYGAPAGIGLSTLLFALLHGEPIHALLAMPLGLHLGLLAWWGNSTRPAVVCHAANNVAAVLLFSGGVSQQASWTPVGVGVLLTCGGWSLALWRSHRAGQSPLQPRRGSDDR